METKNNSFLGNIILKGKLITLTPLHIGGSKDKFEIGGVDNPVIKDPVTNYPYIPGSSLKGKLRMLLEFAKGKVIPTQKNNSTDYLPSKDPVITNLFGKSIGEEDDKKDPFGPTRIIVRDSYPDKETIILWENTNSETLYTEYKAENTIDRMTSAANPRFIERVHKGSKFEVEFILQVFSLDLQKDENADDIKEIENSIWQNNFNKLTLALKLLEDSTLGGGGSRGSGKVEFKFYEPYFVSVEDYKTGKGNFKKEFVDKDNKEVQPILITKDLNYAAIEVEIKKVIGE